MKELSDYILSISNDQWYIVYIAIIIISYLMYLITRNVVLKSISHFFKKTSTDIDDILIEKGIFSRLSYLVPLTLPKTRNNNLNEVRTMFVHHKATLFTSSIIVTLAVVLSVLLTENLPF